MSSTVTRRKAKPEPVKFWDRAAVLKYFGGISVATLYRGVAQGVFPKPANVSANCVRWVASECIAASQRMIAERDAPRDKPRRGRPRRPVSL